MSKLNFSDCFKRIVTEKTHGLTEKKCYVFYTKKDIRKAEAAFMFKKEFSVYPKSVSSLTYKKEVKSRTKRKVNSRAVKLKKFFFHLSKDDNIKIDLI